MIANPRLQAPPLLLERPPQAALPGSNRLLGALPRDSRAQLLQACEPVELAFGQCLYEPDAAIEHVYFPDTSFVSVIATAEHRELEVGLIGNEGMIGIPLVLGLEVSRLRTLVQGPGRALCMRARDFARELQANPALRRKLNRYLYVRFVDLAQSALCNRFHLVEARLARLLLMAHDRAVADSFHLTHRLIAGMLGVRRSGVTTAAGVLQRRGVISYSRGVITVLDRAGLERESCICYRMGLATYERLLS